MALHSQGLITDEVLVLHPKNPEFSHNSYDRFDLDEMDEAECKAEFRIRGRDIFLSADALGLPVTFRRTFDLHF